MFFPRPSSATPAYLVMVFGSVDLKEFWKETWSWEIPHVQQILKGYFHWCPGRNLIWHQWKYHIFHLPIPLFLTIASGRALLERIDGFSRKSCLSELDDETTSVANTQGLICSLEGHKLSHETLFIRPINNGNTPLIMVIPHHHLPLSWPIMVIPHES